MELSRGLGETYAAKRNDEGVVTRKERNGETFSLHYAALRVQASEHPNRMLESWSLTQVRSVCFLIHYLHIYKFRNLSKISVFMQGMQGRLWSGAAGLWSASGAPVSANH